MRFYCGKEEDIQAFRKTAINKVQNQLFVHLRNSKFPTDSKGEETVSLYIRHHSSALT
jgi:hypothetical protein